MHFPQSLVNFFFDFFVWTRILALWPDDSRKKEHWNCTKAIILRVFYLLDKSNLFTHCAMVFFGVQGMAILPQESPVVF
jgi:hypothetical protein